MKRERYSLSLVDLCREVLGYEDIGSIHREMEVVLGDKKFKLFIIPRGHLKSSFLTIGYPIQKLIKDPENRILIANATWDNARKFLKEIKSKTQLDTFKELYGVWETEHWNMDEVTIPRKGGFKEASISTTGLEKVITGQHYDTIICDDLVSGENITTPDQLRKVINYYESLIPILEPDGELIVVGTPWHMLDLYAHIKKNLQDQFVVFNKGIKEDGKYVFPEKFNDEVVARLKANMRPSLFASQFLCQPIAEEDQVIKHEYFRFYEQLPENITVVNTTVDLAVSEKHDADETAIVTVGWTPNSDMYLLNVRHGRWGSEKKVEEIYSEYRKNSPFYIGIEKDAQQKFFTDLLRMYEFRGYERLPITDTSSGGKRKEDRIMNLEPLFRAGKIFFPKTSPFTETVMAQFLSFTPSGTHGLDDIIDAIAAHLQLYTPFEFEKKHINWTDKNKDLKKDLNYYSNAVLWETEDYNREKNLRAQDNWLSEIEGLE